MKLRPSPKHLAALAAGALLASLAPGSALAQSGALKSGVRGRVVIAPELAAATTLPLDPEDHKRLLQGARVRRPTGRAALKTPTEPMPELLVVLEGARGVDKPAPRALRVEGMRFVPAQLLVTHGGEVQVSNGQKAALTIARVGGDVLGTVEPGASVAFSLEDGEHTLEVREMPFARAQVKVLGVARFLPVTAAGEIEPLAIESGEYQLAFYQGARALRVQSLPVPDDRYLAIDAAVSANGVVTVSIKDGDLQVAAPAVPIAPPAPPPPPPRAPAVAPKPPAPKPPSPSPAPPASKPAAVEEIPLEDLEQ